MLHRQPRRTQVDHPDETRNYASCSCFSRPKQRDLGHVAAEHANRPEQRCISTPPGARGRQFARRSQVTARR